jgi:hypothetical protein
MSENVRFCPMSQQMRNTNPPAHGGARGQRRVERSAQNEPNRSQRKTALAGSKMRKGGDFDASRITKRTQWRMAARSHAPARVHAMAVAAVVGVASRGRMTTSRRQLRQIKRRFDRR